METTSIPEGEGELAALVKRVEAGEDVVITRGGQPVARLVFYYPDPAPRVGGQWAGRIRIAEDFDTLPPDIAEAFGMGPE